MTEKANLDAKAQATSKHHKLGASRSNDSGFDLQANAGGLSIMLWGLVLAKAKQGFQAASAKDSTTVKSKLSKVTLLISLIIGAAVCGFVAQSDLFAAEESSPKKALKSKHSLQSSNMPESFYDENSPHYMGGAHNVALKQLAEGSNKKTIKEATSKKSVKKTNDVSMHSKALEHVASGALMKSLSNEKTAVKSSKKTVNDEKVDYLGNHNAALASLAKSTKSKIGDVPNAFKKEFTKKANVSHKPFNFVRAAKVGASIFGVALCLAFHSVMKSYHAALKKQEQLTKLFNNPNARVAAGAQGKAVLKKIAETKKQAKKAPKKKVVKAAPKKVVKKSESEETLEKILKLL